MTSKIAIDGTPMQADEYLQIFSDTRSPTELCEAPVKQDDEYYNMGHKHRGKLIIFNHEKYLDESTPDREGTGADLQRLGDVFHKLGFHVKPYQDKTAAEIQDILHGESQDRDFNKNSDCVVIAVMTHGEDDGVVHASDHEYQVETLWANFTANACPELAGKPKIFLIQACRGDEVTAQAMLGSSIQTDGRPPSDNSTRYSIPCEADLIIAYSTFPGRVAYRVTNDGSWFVQDLCKQMEAMGTHDDLMSIFTSVNRHVAIYREHNKCKQMPMILSTLTRRICFGCQATHADGQLSDRIVERLKEIVLAPDVPTRKAGPKTRTGFEDLRPLCRSYTIPSTENEVMKIAIALKQFIETRISERIREEGQTILHLMSAWRNLSYETRYFAYSKMVEFLQTHARDWPPIELITLPEFSPRRKSSASARETTDVARYNSMRRALPMSRK